MHYRGEVRFSAIRQLVTHTNYMAPYNLFMNMFSKLPNDPILTTEGHEDLDFLRSHWEEIRDEAIKVSESGDIKASKDLDDVGFNSFFKTGWTRFYLKWYGNPLPSAERLCPRTIELLSNTKTIRAAMFAKLPSGGLLSKHRDPFAGSLRYHLGLVTPNSDDCFILVDGIKHSWRDGEDVLFDETYIHEAYNNTDTDRIVLFCDVNRPMKFRWVDRVNDFVSNTLIKASMTKNEEGEEVGTLNKIFGKVYGLRTISKRIKRWNKPVYKTLKISLFLGLIYLIFF